MYAFFLTVLTREIAYLDPGSGSFLLQLLIGGFVGLLFAIKTFWQQIKTFFLKLLGKTSDTLTETTGLITEEKQDEN